MIEVVLSLPVADGNVVAPNCKIPLPAKVLSKAPALVNFITKISSLPALVSSRFPSVYPVT